MKNQLIILSALIILTLCVPAHAQTQQDALADATHMVTAEANITRDAVTRMLQQMADHSAEVEFNAIDYRIKTAAFQRRISAVLQAFEAQLRDSNFQCIATEKPLRCY